jgi:precorrin-2/cobalt-factor-2 C20-methyltransferase
MNGKFYGVGVGPGDPMLITYKAVETIKNSDIIAVPNSGAGENIALKIAKEHIKGKKIIECDMPMTREEKKLEEYHNKATDLISKLLDNGKIVSFLTLGDPSIYSSVMYVHKRLTKKGYDTALIPGVTSFCAAAASLNTSLCEKDELLHIIPASYKDTDKALSLYGNKVLMKSGKSIMDIKEKLNSINKNAMMVECASMENEKVYYNINDIDENASYFSLIVVKENIE